jgi:hypothetical protein
VQSKPKEELDLRGNRGTPKFIGPTHACPTHEVGPIGRTYGVLTIVCPAPDEAVWLQWSQLKVAEHSPKLNILVEDGGGVRTLRF